MNRTLAMGAFGGLLVLGAGNCAKGIPIPEPTKTVSIPGGIYTIGATFTDSCQQASCDSAAAARPVQLDAFLIDEHEVTIRQYAACMHLEKCCWDNQTDTDYTHHGDQPARVTIDEARQYCAWVAERGTGDGGRPNVRLPTEAEWEVAARLDGSGKLRTYPWGDSPATCGEVPGNDCPGDEQFDVMSATKDRTPRGVWDMGGSQSEWVEDDYTPFAACQSQIPLALFCGNDSSCYTSMCKTGTCLPACNSGVNNMECATSNGNGYMCRPASRPPSNPVFMTRPRSVTLGNVCGGNWGNGTVWPVTKGGGRDASRCLQNPARRTIALDATNGGISSPGGDGRRRAAFRCVTAPAANPMLSAELPLNSYALTCGPITLSLDDRTSKPAAWGRAEINLVWSGGTVPATYSSTTSSYTIDVSTATLPSCTAAVANPRIVLSGLALESYALVLFFKTTGGCDTVRADVSLDLTQGKQLCDFNYSPPPFTCFN